MLFANPLNVMHPQKRGTEEFWVPAVAGAVSTGLTYENNKAANDRQQTAETQNIIDQQQIQNKAAAGANQLTQQIAKDSPTAIQNTEAGKLVAQLRKNAAGNSTTSSGDSNLFGAPVSALPTNVNGSSRFKTGVANGQSQVQQYGDTQAANIAGMDAPVRERQNEGLAMQDYSTALNGDNLRSWGTNFVNQLRAMAQGQPNPWVSLGAGLLGNGASTASKTGMFAPSNTGATADQYWDGVFGGKPLG